MPKQITRLNNIDVLVVEGPDSARFLQGQLTCNVEKVTGTFSVSGACCNLKGRVITDFILFLHNSRHVLLMPEGMGKALKQVLDKYIVFSKASTRLLGQEEFTCYGLLGDALESTIASQLNAVPVRAGDIISTDDLSLLRIESVTPRYLIVGMNPSGHGLNELVSHCERSGCQTADPEIWHAADVEAGIAHITPEVQELHTPQVLNYDLRGMVDFRKGCYTGQEIIARMHYKGRAKKRLFRLQVPGSCTDPLRLSQALSSGTGEPEILACSGSHSGAVEVLAILPVDVSLSKESIALLPLPYDSD